MDERLTATEMDHLCGIIHRVTGLTIRQHQQDALHDYFTQMRNQDSNLNLERYLEAIQNKPTSSAEYKELMEILTIGESYFFRDEPQMSFLRNTWLPQLIRERRASGSKSLRIWSAGCSEGQELYSIAIMLSEIISDIDDWSIYLIGSDINLNSISKAMKGCYSSWSIREMDSRTLKRNFSEGGDTYQLQRNIGIMASFFYINLLDSSYPSLLNGTVALDLIICRNVLLYFNDAVTQKTLNQLEQCLAPNGIILIGHTDAYAKNIPTSLIAEHSNKVTYYKQNIPEIAPLFAFDGGVTKTIQQNVPEPKEPIVSTGLDQTAPLNYIYNLYKKLDWVNVLVYARQHERDIENDSSALLYTAIASVHLGRLDEAMAICHNALKLDELNPGNYLIQSVILQAGNKLQESEKTLHQSIFLEANFVDAHYFLGLLLLRQNKTQQGLKALHHALAMLNEHDTTQALYLEPNMNYAEFGQTLEHEIRIYEGDLGDQYG